MSLTATCIELEKSAMIRKIHSVLFIYAINSLAMAHYLRFDIALWQDSKKYLRLDESVSSLLKGLY